MIRFTCGKNLRLRGIVKGVKMMILEKWQKVFDADLGKQKNST